MYGIVKQDVREIIQTLCGYKQIKITADAVCVDHVHLCIVLPPKYSTSSFMGYLKRKCTLIIFDIQNLELEVIRNSEREDTMLDNWKYR